MNLDHFRAENVFSDRKKMMKALKKIKLPILD